MSQVEEGGDALAVSMGYEARDRGQQPACAL